MEKIKCLSLWVKGYFGYLMQYILKTNFKIKITFNKIQYYPEITWNIPGAKHHIYARLYSLQENRSQSSSVVRKSRNHYTVLSNKIITSFIFILNQVLVNIFRKSFVVFFEAFRSYHLFFQRCKVYEQAGRRTFRLLFYMVPILLW